MSIFFYTSCDSKPNIKYYHIINDKYKTLGDGDIKEGRENGKWSLSRKEGVIIAKGEYKNGLKIGKWDYVYKDSIFAIDWDIYTEGNLQINLPKSWIVTGNDIDLLQATFNIKSNKNYNKYQYLIINETNSYTHPITVNEYLNQLDQTMIQIGDVKSVRKYLLRNNSNDIRYVVYDITRNGKLYLVHNFIRQLDQKIIFVSYSSLSSSKQYKELLFFELLFGCYYFGDRFLDPLKPLFIEKI